MTRVDSPVPFMLHDPDKSWTTDPVPDHPKGTQPESLLRLAYNTSDTAIQVICTILPDEQARASIHSPRQSR